MNSSARVSITVPLLIRLLEWAREDAESDNEIHQAVENLVQTDGDMDDFEDIVSGRELETDFMGVAEAEAYVAMRKNV